MKAFFFVVGLFAGIGLCAFQADLAYKVKKDLEKIEEISIKYEHRQEELKMPEMRDNAELSLTYDEKAHLRMMRNNPHFKINTKV